MYNGCDLFWFVKVNRKYIDTASKELYDHYCCDLDGCRLLIKRVGKTQEIIDFRHMSGLYVDHQPPEGKSHYYWPGEVNENEQ